MSAYTCCADTPCDQCGDDSEKYIKFSLYNCSSCEQTNLRGYCTECFFNPARQPFCSECYNKKEDVQKCNECCRVLQCEFSTCWTCDKTDICINCLKYTNEDNRKPLCMNCYKEYILVKNKT
jgi:hypothetical protein